MTSEVVIELKQCAADRTWEVVMRDPPQYGLLRLAEFLTRPI